MYVADLYGVRRGHVAPERCRVLRSSPWPDWSRGLARRVSARTLRRSSCSLPPSTYEADPRLTAPTSSSPGARSRRGSGRTESRGGYLCLPRSGPFACRCASRRSTCTSLSRPVPERRLSSHHALMVFASFLRPRIDIIHTWRVSSVPQGPGATTSRAPSSASPLSWTGSVPRNPCVVCASARPPPPTRRLGILLGAVAVGIVRCGASTTSL